MQSNISWGQIVYVPKDVKGLVERYSVAYVQSVALSCVSGPSILYSFRDGRQVAVWLVLCGVLPPGLVQYCSQHSCVIAV